MLIGKVLGEVIASHKHESYEGLTVLMVQPVNLDGTKRGSAMVAVDSVGAGKGQTVLLAPEGFCAMSAVNRMQTPIDAAVLGIVDHIDLADAAIG
ncbi:MAG: EutN/CcmL family microcompartment protein [Bryobacterales bacterium]|nr:EutN/CcmL family microcompartment protein [Bryobacterales bacterium]